MPTLNLWVRSCRFVFLFLTRLSGIDPDYVGPKDDKRRVVIKQLDIVFKDHDKRETLTFNTPEEIKNAKKHPLTIKEGAMYKMQVTFRVQHELVAGFKIVNKVSKMGKEIKDVEMIGSYPPSNEFKALDIPRSGWNEAPSGALLRGDYKAKMQFTDDDGSDHLTFDYAIKIASDYAK